MMMRRRRRTRRRRRRPIVYPVLLMGISTTICNVSLRAKQSYYGRISDEQILVKRWSQQENVKDHLQLLNPIIITKLNGRRRKSTTHPFSLYTALKHPRKCVQCTRHLGKCTQYTCLCTFLWVRDQRFPESMSVLRTIMILFHFEDKIFILENTFHFNLYSTHQYLSKETTHDHLC